MLTIKCFNHLTHSDDHAMCRVFEAPDYRRNNHMGWVEFLAPDGITVLTTKNSTLDVVGAFPDHIHLREFDKIIVENQTGKTIDIIRSLLIKADDPKSTD